jgi:tetratricopeptide (TPR) repeat protein
LPDDDALSLWRALNVKGSRAELVPIFRSVEGHPLLIQALASEIANYRKAPGDFAQWRADHRRFDPASFPLVQSRTHILQFALEGLSTNVREVLRTLVGFRMPASYATLEALLVGQGKACNSAEQLDHALTELEDRGLIGWDRVANRYDAHPIVRAVVWQLTDPEDQHAVYAALEAHFEPMSVPESDKVETLADLTPAIERYHTLVGLGRYDDAFDLFRVRLETATLYRLAAHRERIAWLEPLFQGSATGVPALTREPDQAGVFNALAQSYLFSGEPSRSAPLFRRALEIYEQTNSGSNQAVALSNLADALREIGALREADGALRRALVLNRELGDAFREAVALENLGVVLGTAGHGLGQLALRRSRTIFEAQGNRQWVGLVSAYLAELELWAGGFAKAGIWAERAWGMAAIRRFERDYIRAALFQGRVALGVNASSRADERLHFALTRSRAVNSVDFELPALIAVAELELRRSRTAEAKARLDEVWEAAERGPYPCDQADAFNVLTAIALAEEDRKAAIVAAANAYKAAWCDGPPYAYYWGLEKAKAHLAALGAPEPEMPPFDESKFEPLPEVEINPRDKYWIDPDKLDQLLD